MIAREEGQPVAREKARLSLVSVEPGGQPERVRRGGEPEGGFDPRNQDETAPASGALAADNSRNGKRRRHGAGSLPCRRESVKTPLLFSQA